MVFITPKYRPERPTEQAAITLRNKSVKGLERNSILAYFVLQLANQKAKTWRFSMGACLSNPELTDQLVYRLSLKSMTINVYREDQITTTIDGNQFLF